jgi:hypothetical protein
VGAFPLSEKALVEKIVQISHNFFLMLKRGAKEMKGTEITGPVILVISVSVTEIGSPASSICCLQWDSCA